MGYGVRTGFTNEVFVNAPTAPVAGVIATFKSNYGGAADTTQTISSGILTALTTNTFTRPGYTFGGWTANADGTGSSFTENQQVTITTATNYFAKWNIPTAARLIGTGTGSIVTISGSDSTCVGASAKIRGMATNGSNIFFRPSGSPGTICVVDMSGVFVSKHSVAGLSSISADSIDISFSSGCIFIRNSGLANSALNCIDVSKWNLTSIITPSGKGLLKGPGWNSGNLISFPDGRIGGVSENDAANSDALCLGGAKCKTLRLYNVIGSGDTSTLTFSEDVILADTETWPSDNHGIATDGTYLYQTMFSSGYKVWTLASGAASSIIFNAAVTGAGSCTASTGVSNTLCRINNPVDGTTSGLTNATYISRNHTTSQYIMADYEANRFYLSAAETPPAGLGSAQAALDPAFNTPTSTSDGFTVTITNFDSNFTWGTPSVTSGSVSVTSTTGSNRVLTVTGLASGASATITQANSRTGYVPGRGTVLGTASTLGTALTPTFGTPTATADGFTVSITNFDADFTWGTPSVTSGSVSVTSTTGSNRVLTVTGLSSGATATITQNTTRSGYANGSATVSGTASTLGIARTPTFGTPTATADGFTVSITNYDADFTWATPTVSAGSVTVTSTIGSTRVLTVTGLSSGATATITQNTTRSGYANGTATVSGTATTSSGGGGGGGGGGGSGGSGSSPTTQGPANSVNMAVEKVDGGQKLSWSNSSPVTVIIKSFNGAESKYENVNNSLVIANPKPGESKQIVISDPAKPDQILETKTIYQAPLAAQNLTIKQITSKSLQVAWRPTSTVIGYRVVITPTVGAPVIVDTTDPKFAVQTAPGQRYTFEVIAIGAGGLESGTISMSASLTTGKVETPLLEVSQTIRAKAFTQKTKVKLNEFAKTIAPDSSILCTGSASSSAGRASALAAASRACTTLQQANPEIFVKPVAKIVSEKKNPRVKKSFIVGISVVIKPIS